MDFFCCALSKLQAVAPQQSSGFSSPGPPSRPPGNRRRSSAIPGAGGPGHCMFFLATRIEEAPPGASGGAGAAPPPITTPPRPSSGSHRLLHTLGQAGGQYGPSTAPFGRARCPFLPLVTPYSPGGAAARGSHTGQFSCFVLRTSQLFYSIRIGIGIGGT
jgi:hypothetical protein